VTHRLQQLERIGAKAQQEFPSRGQSLVREFRIRRIQRQQMDARHALARNTGVNLVGGERDQRREYSHQRI
jgi:hypothetical protein